MPAKMVTAEEFQALTGERGSFVIETAPRRRRPKPQPKGGLLFPGDEGYGDPDIPSWGLVMGGWDDE